MNLNKVFLIGRLTRDPESRAMPSGQSVSAFGLATNRVWTNPETNEKQEQTEFHNIVAFGNLADICNQHLTKGKLILIEGRIQTRSWQNQNGETRYRTEVVTERLQMGPRTAQPGEVVKEAEPETGTKEVEEIQVEEGEEEKPKKTRKDQKENEVRTEDIPF